MISLTSKTSKSYQVVLKSQYSYLNDTLKFDSLKDALGQIYELREAAMSLKDKTVKLQNKGDGFILYDDFGTILEVWLPTSNF